MPDITSNRNGAGLWSLLLLILSLSVACQRRSDFYFVKNAGAIMPVEVRGNTASDQFLILLPGGPAGEGLIYSQLFPAFSKPLEAQCQVVYYDQRGAGNCQGRYESSTLNLQQLSEDLHAIVRTIKDRNKQARVYLLAYSYGGALGMSYLLQPEYQSAIAGMISIAGAFDRADQATRQSELVEYLLQNWVESGYLEHYDPLLSGFRCDTAQDVSACRQDSLMISQKVAAKFDQIARYNRFKLDTGTALRLLQYAFFSQSNPLQSGVAETQHGRFYQKEFDSLLLSRQLAEVSIPALFINGRLDTNVPFFVAQAGYDRIGTPEDKKSLLILQQSGHLPILTEPRQLAESILDFLNHQ